MQFGSKSSSAYTPVWVAVERQWWPALHFRVPEELTGCSHERAILFGSRKVQRQHASFPSLPWSEGLKQGCAKPRSQTPAFARAMKEVDMFMKMSSVPADWPKTYMGLLETSVALATHHRPPAKGKFLERLLSSDTESKTFAQKYAVPPTQTYGKLDYGPIAPAMNPTSNDDSFRKGFAQQLQQWRMNSAFMGQATPPVCNMRLYRQGSGSDAFHGAVQPNPIMNINIARGAERNCLQDMGPCRKRKAPETNSVVEKTKQHKWSDENLVDLVEELTGAPYVQPEAVSLREAGLMGGAAGRLYCDKIQQQSGQTANIDCLDKGFGGGIVPMNGCGDDWGKSGLQAVLHDVYEIVLGRVMPNAAGH